jgi:hypothetical protein
MGMFGVLAFVALLVSVSQAGAATFNVTVTGAGNGIVSGSGIDCNKGETGGHNICTVSGFGVTSVELAASPDPGSAFTDWAVSAGAQTPNPCAASPTCKVATLGTSNITATFIESLPAPNVTFEPPGNLGPSEATFHGTVNPNGNPTTWRFEYRAVGAAVWRDAPTPNGDAGEGTDAVPVQATAQGLEPNSEYEARLRAENVSSAAVSGVESFRTEGLPPAVQANGAWSVGATTATLAAMVNPENAVIGSCTFEYGVTEAYGHATPCIPGGPLLGGSPTEAVARIAGLEPASTYYFRIVVSNECATGCGNAEAQGIPFLTRKTTESEIPRRGYELVSAEDTNGIQAYPNLASANGDQFAYLTFIPVPGSMNGTTSFFRAVRQEDGSWTQQPIGPPAPRPGQQVLNTQPKPLFSATLDVAAFGTAENLDPDDAAGGVVSGDTYLDSLSDGITWVSRNRGIPLGTVQTEPEGASGVGYISPDGERVIFSAERVLIPGAAASSLYSWNAGSLDLISRIPPSGSRCVETAPGGCVPAGGSSELGSGGRFTKGTTADAVSTSGQSVIFQVQYGQTVSERRLYLRLGDRETRDASYSPLDPSPTDVTFWGADRQGSRVFFTSSSALTPDSSAPDMQEGATDLYEYNAATEMLRDLTPFPGGADVLRVYAVSGDGHRVFFTSSKDLEGEGTPGGPNLYLAEIGADGSLLDGLRFIATVHDPAGLPETESNNYVNQAFREVDANEEGSVLAFRSTTPLVPGRLTGGLPQVYVYEVARHELSCASCPSDGVPASAPADLTPSIRGASGALEPLEASWVNPEGPHVRNVDSDGGVVFQTASTLVPRDVNNGKIDVYEWRGGSLGLISSGSSGDDSYLGDASSNGGSVFFDSGQSLVSGAEEGVRHVYVARIGGGYSSPPGPPACAGGDCRTGGGAVSTSPGASSARFVGPGNQVPRARCKRGFAHRDGKCVKKLKRRRAVRRKHRGHQHHNRVIRSHRSGGAK